MIKNEIALLRVMKSEREAALLLKLLMKQMKSSKKIFVLWRGDSIPNYFTKNKTINKKGFLTWKH